MIPSPGERPTAFDARDAARILLSESQAGQAFCSKSIQT
jgi:hypothetical protein